MITYPRETYVPEFREHMLWHTEGLPNYIEEDGTETTSVDYTNVVQAYALNVTLIHDDLTDLGAYGHTPSPLAEVLVVRRARGHGKIGTWDGVTGYVGERVDPAIPGAIPDPNDGFDPLVFTLKAELSEECSIDDDVMREIDFRAGEWHDFPRSEPSYPEGAHIRVVPVLGICVPRPEIIPKLDEISAYEWVRLNKLKDMQELDKGYLEKTLPTALGTLGLTEERINRLLNAV